MNNRGYQTADPLKLVFRGRPPDVGGDNRGYQTADPLKRFPAQLRVRQVTDNRGYQTADPLKLLICRVLRSRADITAVIRPRTN